MVISIQDKGKILSGGKIKIPVGSGFLFVCLFGGVSSTNLIESRLGAGGEIKAALGVVQMCSPEASKSHPGT